MITSKERALLRKAANTLPAAYQIGKGGMTEAVIHQLSEALEASELIKIRLLEASDLSAKEAASSMAKATSSNIVQCIGHIFVLYRPHRDKTKRKYLP